MRYNKYDNRPVTTALLLAAGMGSRLFPLTQNEPKCLTIVNGISILERLISNLKRHGFKRLVIVTGYLENRIREFLGDQVGNIAIDYVFSPLYKTTNNIYSLWMARKAINEPFLLLESDLVFDDSLIESMLYPDSIAVAKMHSWLNGTCVTINHPTSRSQQVKAFFLNDSDTTNEVKYKTVNIYSISLISWRRIVKKLDQYISAGKVNVYYENIFADMISDSSLSFKIVSFDGKPWYEIDTIEDLAKAEKLFPSNNYKNVKTATRLKSDFFNTQLINPLTAS